MMRPALAALALALTGCAAPREPLPAVLPHYPCAHAEQGRTVYRACDVPDWLAQQSAKGAK